MRIIFLIVACLLASPARASDIKFPALTGRNVDTADQIPADQEAALDAELTAFEKATGHQFVVVTIPDLGDIPNEDYAFRLGRHWGIGRSEEHTSELQSLMRIAYAVSCLIKKTTK